MRASVNPSNLNRIIPAEGFEHGLYDRLASAARGRRKR
jgi:hypothetical protein